MRSINNLEVAAVSGGFSREDASTLLGAYFCADLFAGSFSYPAGGMDLGKGVAIVGGMITGAVVGRFVDHVVSDYVFPLTDSVTP